MCNKNHKGVLSLREWDGTRNKKGVRVYFVTCSKCSLDKELYNRDFKTTMGEFKRGSIPCGCARNPRYTEQQYTTLVKRRAKTLGYNFNGFSGEYCKKSTKLLLHNPTTGNEWNTTSIKDFLNSDTKDPLVGRLTQREKLLKSDEVMESIFKENIIYKGFKFHRSQKVGTDSSYWDYTCPSCSDDEYVKAGVCEGVFTSGVSCLKGGSLSCRCSLSFRWTKEQREYQISKICKEEGLVFLSWVGDRKTSKGKFKWRCKEGHLCETSVSEFVNKGARCNTCAKLGRSWGLYKDKLLSQDNLYVLQLTSGDEKFIKVGRSFHIKKRLYTLQKDSGCKVKLLSKVTDKHCNIFDLEQQLHKDLSEFMYIPQESFAGQYECFRYDSLQQINMYLSNREVSV